MSARFEVCIVSYDSAGVIGSAVRSVADQIDGVAIAVREHGPVGSGAAEAAEVAAAVGAPIRVETDTTNPGFGAGCNELARTSTAEWLVFLNPDAQVVQWPFNLHQPAEHSIIGAEISGNGAPARHFGTSYTIRDEIRRSWLRRFGPRPHGIGFVSGAALLIRREDFEVLGGFDESYFLFYEDIDLCERANDAGIQVQVDSGWKVHHLGAHSTRSRFGESLNWSFRSAVTFHAAHGESVMVYRAYVAVDSLLRAIVGLVRFDGAAAKAYLRLFVLACSAQRVPA